MDDVQELNFGSTTTIGEKVGHEISKSVLVDRATERLANWITGRGYVVPKNCCSDIHVYTRIGRRKRYIGNILVAHPFPNEGWKFFVHGEEYFETAIDIADAASDELECKVSVKLVTRKPYKRPVHVYAGD